MTEQPWWQRDLERGCCPRGKASECAKCRRAYAALDRLAAVVDAAHARRDLIRALQREGRAPIVRVQGALSGLERALLAGEFISDTLDALDKEPGE